MGDNTRSLVLLNVAGKSSINLAVISSINLHNDHTNPFYKSSFIRELKFTINNNTHLVFFMKFLH